MSRPSPAAVAKLVVGVGIAAFFGWRAFHNLDWKASGEAIRGADPRWIAFAVLALAADYTLRVARWWVMLRAIRPELPLSACFRPFLGSIALNNTLPFRAGDVARAVGFRKDLGMETSEIVGTMVIERLLDLLSILAVFAVALTGAKPGGVPQSLVSGTIVAASIGGLVLLALLLVPHRAARFVERTAKGGRGKRVAGAVARFLDSLSVLRSPSRAAGLVALSLVAWLFEGATFAGVALALHQARGASGGWFAMSVGTLSTLIPSTPGYVGVFDYFTSIAFEAYGMAKGASSLAALVVHVVVWLPLTLAGFTLLALGARRKAAVPALAPETP